MSHALRNLALLIAAGAAAAGAADALSPDPAGQLGRDTLARLAFFRTGLQNYRGQATLTIAGGERPGTYNVSFGRVLPDKSRLEIGTPLGGTAFILTAKAGTLMAYNVPERAAGVGPDSREHVAAALDADLGGNLGEILDWLAGIPGTMEADVVSGKIWLEATAAGGDVTASWSGPDDGILLQEITLDEKTGRLKSARRFDGGEIAASAEFDEWKKEKGFEFARHAVVKTADVSCDIKITKLEANVEIPAEAFALETPPGTESIIYWKAGGDDGDER